MERRTIVISGVVQGVGFRPFVYHLASSLALGGFVRNRAGTVEIELEGDTAALDRFLEGLVRQPPPLAHIESLSWEPKPPLGDRTFHIESSAGGPSDNIFVSPDAAVCSECLRELLDPADRRYRYPFLNCTNCGPRLTIVNGSPYDRANTTMARFPMCAACRAEYDDPANRRFHAQPTACPACGPRLSLHDAAKAFIAEGNPLDRFVRELFEGKIGAVKGLGGFHLTCDARNTAAVAELRQRKHRDEKPFAIMVADEYAAARFCEVGPREAELLRSPAAPIVLLRKRVGPPLADVAPGNPCLGVMLPYSPLHHLLVRAVGGVPLVMTSGNRSDEPIAYRDDALDTLAGIADYYLTHDRPIHVRCDDSVVRVVDGRDLPVRRSRGYAPRPISLPLECSRPLLAVGGQLKGAFALALGRQAFLSHHLGDLDHAEAFRAFENDIGLYERLFGIEPALLVHDSHPDYSSTRYAIRRAAGPGIPLLAVQHHHAHMASCMAEHGLTGLAIGVTFDGTGYGADGTVWGGEFLVGDYLTFRRAGHLRPVPMPGGDRAIKEPWRMALAHRIDAGNAYPAVRSGASPTAERVVRIMLERGLNSPLTSSMGRLFDAVAAIAGVRATVSYEGQAAVELEALATGKPSDGSYPFELEGQDGDPLVVDTRPLIRAVAEDVEAGVEPCVIARRFHTTVVEMVATMCGRIRAGSGHNRVVLSGGVFLNVLLAHEACERLRDDGFEVYRHERVPPNDGGLALGQAAIGAARITGVE